jgi:uncharacterized protein (TIGR03435 family)
MWFTRTAFWRLIFTVTMFRRVFDAASIRLHPEPITSSSDAQAMRNRATGTAVRILIANACVVRYDEISGGTKWIHTDRYDVAA